MVELVEPSGLTLIFHQIPLILVDQISRTKLRVADIMIIWSFSVTKLETLLQTQILQPLNQNVIIFIIIINGTVQQTLLPFNSSSYFIFSFFLSFFSIILNFNFSSSSFFFWFRWAMSLPSPVVLGKSFFLMVLFKSSTSHWRWPSWCLNTHDMLSWSFARLLLERDRFRCRPMKSWIWKRFVQLSWALFLSSRACSSY